MSQTDTPETPETPAATGPVIRFAMTGIGTVTPPAATPTPPDPGAA